MWSWRLRQRFVCDDQVSLLGDLVLLSSDGGRVWCCWIVLGGISW